MIDNINSEEKVTYSDLIKQYDFLKFPEVKALNPRHWPSFAIESILGQDLEDNFYKYN